MESALAPAPGSCLICHTHIPYSAVYKPGGGAPRCAQGQPAVALSSHAAVTSLLHAQHVCGNPHDELASWEAIARTQAPVVRLQSLATPLQTHLLAHIEAHALKVHAVAGNWSDDWGRCQRNCGMLCGGAAGTSGLQGERPKVTTSIGHMATKNMSSIKFLEQRPQKYFRKLTLLQQKSRQCWA